ncbi:unnamed protein product [Ectocarpus sp. CCAP 1310/34]|nr:unnamed protein product [Ectocarpus sp. CCAP 1310/34]
MSLSSRLPLFLQISDDDHYSCCQRPLEKSPNAALHTRITYLPSRLSPISAFILLPSIPAFVFFVCVCVIDILHGSAFCATCVSAESVERAQNNASPLMGRWKWGSDNPQAFFEANFPEGWSFNGVTCGTPGEFPEGADYGVGFVGKAPAYVIGYFSSSSSSSSGGGSG